MGRHVIKVPIFKADIYYSCGNWQSMLKWLNETYKPGYKISEYGNEIELTYSSGTTGRVFVVTDNSGTEVDYWFWSGEKIGDDSGYCGWIAHEAMHLTTEICRQIETPLTAQTEEIYAYLLEYIVTELLSLDWPPKPSPLLDGEKSE